MDRAAAEAYIRSSASPEHAKVLIAHLQNSQRINAQPAAMTLPSLKSRFGGEPALPDDVPWPHWDSSVLINAKIDRVEKRKAAEPEVKDALDLELESLRRRARIKHAPLSFLAQINVGELPESGSDLALPSNGVLCFFYDIINEPWGFDPAARGAWQVLHIRDEQAGRRDPPSSLPEHARFPEAKVTFVAEAVLPTSVFQLLGPDAGNWSERYLPLHQPVADPNVPHHRLRGYPAEIQGDMRLTCQLATNGIYCDADGYRDPRRASLEAGVSEWRMLLQLDSDESLKWCWGDLGRVYFWIRERDLRSQDFSQVWFDLQCC